MSEKASENNIEDKELQDLIDQRIEQKKEEIKKEALEEIENARPNSNNVSKTESKASRGISRRDFLKKAGLGTAGLAALGLAPASALNIRSDQFSVSTGPDPDSLTERLGINDGEVELGVDTGLDANGNDVRGVAELVADRVKALNRMTVPREEPSEKENGEFWVDESSEQLKVKIKDKVFSTGVSAILATVLQPESDDLEHFTGSTGDTAINDNYAIDSVTTGLSLTNSGSINDPVISESGLENYIYPGDRFAAIVYDNGGADVDFVFDWQDNDDFWSLRLVPEEDLIQLQEDSFSISADVASGTGSGIDADEFLEIEGEYHQDGTIVGRVFDVDQSTGERQEELASLSYDGYTKGGGGIAFTTSNSNGTSVSIQNLRILERNL